MPYEKDDVERHAHTTVRWERERDLVSSPKGVNTTYTEYIYVCIVSGRVGLYNKREGDYKGVGYWWSINALVLFHCFTPPPHHHLSCSQMELINYSFNY